MAWIILILSGLLETVWASALGEMAKGVRFWPAALFVIASPLSVAGLAYALRTLPLGPTYAAWVGIGAVGTFAYGAVMLGDTVTTARVLFTLLIVAGIVGLNAAK